jgi:hypothetical protein
VDERIELSDLTLMFAPFLAFHAFATSIQSVVTLVQRAWDYDANS